MEKRSIEDYLRTIHNILKINNNKEVKVTDISKKLNITKATVTQMIKKLKKENYITNKPYSKIELTEKGIKEAKIITQKYNIIVKFLKFVGYKNKEKIIKEAHKLEHAFSSETIKKINRIIK